MSSKSKVLVLDVIPIMEEVSKEAQVIKLIVKAFDPTTGLPTTLGTPQVTIFDPEEIIMAGPSALTQNPNLTNEYSFFYIIPAAPVRGTWRAEFTGIIGGKTHLSNQKFEVI